MTTTITTMKSAPHTAFTENFRHDIRCVFGNANVVSQQGANKQNQPIGVFDSGMGGLSVLQHLASTLPNEHFVYLADTKHVPYGERSPEQIAKLTQAAVAWLYEQGCKLVVVACNSASTHSLPNLRAYYGEKLHIVGLVPALKPAVLATSSKKVAVLATKATLDGYLLNQVIDDIATPANVTVLKYHEPLLVPWVEAGMDTQAQAYVQLKSLLAHITTEQADHLVLGCTHFPFFRQHIAQLAPALKVLDSGAAIAKRVQSLLHTHGLAADLVTDAVTKNINNNQVITKQLSKHTQKTEGSFLLTKTAYFTTNGNIFDKNMIDCLLNRGITQG